MIVPVSIYVGAYHRGQGRWWTYRTPEGVPSLVRAVSRKAALAKALRQAIAMPIYADRVNNPEWEVEAEVTIIDGRL